jgi:hypothetical protein
MVRNADCFACIETLVVFFSFLPSSPYGHMISFVTIGTSYQIVFSTVCIDAISWTASHGSEALKSWLKCHRQPMAQTHRRSRDRAVGSLWQRRAGLSAKRCWGPTLTWVAAPGAVRGRPGWHRRDGLASGLWRQNRNAPGPTPGIGCSSRSG